MARTILITGALTGIGAALAARYAGEGARLALIARNVERLASVEARCRDLGAEGVQLGTLDVRDRSGLAAWIAEYDRRHPIDMVIANAGVLTGVSPRQPFEDADASRRVFEINVLGVMNTLHPLIPMMAARRLGQIGIISSLAGLTPVAHMPSYSASKACVLSYGRSLRALLQPHGVGVSVVCPGFVSTDMTDQIQGPKPFMTSPQEAAERIVQALNKNRAVTAFPLLFSWMTRLDNLLPEAVRRMASRHFSAAVSSLED